MDRSVTGLRGVLFITGVSSDKEGATARISGDVSPMKTGASVAIDFDVVELLIGAGLAAKIGAEWEESAVGRSVLFTQRSFE